MNYLTIEILIFQKKNCIGCSEYNAYSDKVTHLNFIIEALAPPPILF